MTRYTLTNILYPTTDGKEFKIQTTFDDFEGVAEKVAMDLTSVWKGIVPLPLTIKIELAKEEEVAGTKVIQDQEVIAQGDDALAEALEVYGEAMKKLYKNLPTLRGN